VFLFRLLTKPNAIWFGFKYLKTKLFVFVLIWVSKN
jgi:hypothetical protein